MLLDELEKEPSGKRLELLLSALADTGWPVPERYARPETVGAPVRRPPYMPDQLVAPLEGRHELHLTGTPRHRTWRGEVLRIDGPTGPSKGEEARSGHWCAKYATRDYGPEFFMRGKEIAVRADSAEECAMKLQAFLRGLGHQIEIVLRYPWAPHNDRAEPGSAEAAARLREFHRTFPTVHDPERPSLNLGWHRRPQVSLTAGRPHCMGCGHPIENGRVTVPAFEYYFRDDPGSPRVVACWKCWHAARLPDLAEYSQELAELYREWHVLIGEEKPKDRDDVPLVLHGMAARRLVLGGEEADAGESFRRYCRLRLSERCYGMLAGEWHHLSMRDDLEGIADAHNRGFDFPASESWACLAQGPPKVDRPEEMQDWWRVGRLDDHIGFSLGYNAFGEVLLHFEDGAVMAFSPHQLFPAEQVAEGEPVAGFDLTLAYLYRDWLSVTNGDESAPPSEETLAKYQGWAEELVVGGEREREGLEFRRFCRVRLEARSRRLALDAVAEAFRDNVDYPPMEDWECLEENDQHFLDQSWESGRMPSRPCVRCGRPPDDDKEWVWFCGTRDYLCVACQADVLAWADRRRETYKAEAAENDRKMRQARAKARAQAKLPADFPRVIEVDLGRTKGWARADVIKVNDPWLHYQLQDGDKSDKVRLIGEDIVWRRLPMQM
jgi:hypothetical protein